jgi:hypothetical protein
MSRANKGRPTANKVRENQWCGEQGNVRREPASISGAWHLQALISFFHPSIQPSITLSSAPLLLRKRVVPIFPLFLGINNDKEINVARNPTTCSLFLFFFSFFYKSIRTRESQQGKEIYSGIEKKKGE